MKFELGWTSGRRRFKSSWRRFYKTFCASNLQLSLVSWSICPQHASQAFSDAESKARGPTTFNKMTLSIMTLSIMTLSIMDLIATLCINDTEHKDWMSLSCVSLCLVSHILTVILNALCWVSFCWILLCCGSWRRAGDYPRGTTERRSFFVPAGFLLT